MWSSSLRKYFVKFIQHLLSASLVATRKRTRVYIKHKMATIRGEASLAKPILFLYFIFSVLFGK